MADPQLKAIISKLPLSDKERDYLYRALTNLQTTPTGSTTAPTASPATTIVHTTHHEVVSDERIRAVIDNYVRSLPRLSVITHNAGDLIAGRFISPAPTSTSAEPTDSAFTGSFVSGIGEEFDSVTYNMGGVNSGTLQWGSKQDDGTIIAGAGRVELDSTGVSLDLGTDETDSQVAVKWMDGTDTKRSYVIGYATAGKNAVQIEAEPHGSRDSEVVLKGNSPSGKQGKSVLWAYEGSPLRAAVEATTPGTGTASEAKLEAYNSSGVKKATVSATEDTVSEAGLAAYDNSGVSVIQIRVRDDTKRMEIGQDHYFPVRGASNPNGFWNEANQDMDFSFEGTNSAAVVKVDAGLDQAQLGAQVALTGDISPATITADQNDYNPTGLSTASVLRLVTDGSDYNITGLAGGSDGRIIVIRALDTSGVITLVDESLSSTAANRFDLSRDIKILPNRAAVLQYDATISRWRDIATTDAISISGVQVSAALSGTIGDEDILIYNAGDSSFQDVSPTDYIGNFALEAVQDVVGAMFSGNTETGITVTYQDSDGTIDLEVAGSTEVYFSAYLSTNQAITTGTNTVLICNTELKDSGSYYSTSTGKFTPLVAGSYQFTFTAALESLGDGKAFWIGMRKNGGTIMWGAAQVIGAAAHTGPNMTETFYFDGVDDYIEFIVWHNHGSNRNVFGLLAQTRVNGRFISSTDITGL